MKRNRWVWVPLSFIFLILGVVLGFRGRAGLLSRAKPGADGRSLCYRLSVSRFGESYHLKWNPDGGGRAAAKRGELVVEDGATTAPMDLTADSLARGGLIYRGTTRRRDSG